MADFAEKPVRAALDVLIDPGAAVRLCHPFGTVTGPAALYETAYAPLLAAFPDLERRDELLVAGATKAGSVWLGAMGHYVGTFARPFLDIPPTGHLAAFRHHEFYRFDGARVVEVQAVWDIPELMMQAGAWPMAPQLGAAVRAFAPASQDGLSDHGAGGAETAARIEEMLARMVRHPREPAEAMEMPRFWHPRANWYGPAGIGTARGIRGFRLWHQIPFLRAAPDRGQDATGTESHFFGEGPYAAVTGWPDMAMTLTGPNWLGLPATGRRLTLRSLDFWRLEAGLISENWVLVDLLDAHAQAGTDPLARMREFNKARVGFDPDTGEALP
ncbi:MAG: ester cyclase [Paracoccaceae bacterium]